MFLRALAIVALTAPVPPRIQTDFASLSCKYLLTVLGTVLPTRSRPVPSLAASTPPVMASAKSRSVAIKYLSPWGEKCRASATAVA